MTPHPVMKAAAAHVAPVYGDPAATTRKAVALIGEAARNGANLVVFSESFLPGFPLWAALFSPLDTHAHFERFAAASVMADGPEIGEIREAARLHGVFVSLGFSEATRVSVGCLWNSNLLIGDDGAILVHHRKLMPTYYEKLVWAGGDGAGLRVADTRIGRIGALICGENTNPLARFALMAEGEQVHVSSWPPSWPFRRPATGENYDNRAANRVRAGAHSFEAKAFGIACTGFCDRAMREAIAGDDRTAAEVLEETPQGETFFTDPAGQTIGGTAREEEALVYATMDLGAAVAQKRIHDVVGYYNRFDVFDLSVNRRRLAPVRFTEGPVAGAGGPEDEGPPSPDGA